MQTNDEDSSKAENHGDKFDYGYALTQKAEGDDRDPEWACLPADHG